MIGKKKIGVVILNYNDAETTSKLCAKIHGYDSIDHIIIVDNLSPDRSFACLKHLSDGKVEVVQSDKNGGYSYGNNLGAFHLITIHHVDILFIANPDVEFSEEFMKQVVTDMETYHVQAASGFMRMPIHIKQEVAYKTLDSFWGEVLNCTVLAKRIFPYHGEKVLQGTGMCFTEYLQGSLFAIETSVYRELRGLDENVFLYYEEQILGRRFLTAGYRMIVNTDISYLHNHSVSINKEMNRYKQARQYFSSRYYYCTQYGNIGLLKRAVLRLAMTYGLAVRRLLWWTTQGSKHFMKIRMTKRGGA